MESSPSVNLAWPRWLSTSAASSSSSSSDVSRRLRLYLAVQQRRRASVRTGLSSWDWTPLMVSECVSLTCSVIPSFSIMISQKVVKIDTICCRAKPSEHFSTMSCRKVRDAQQTLTFLSGTPMSQIFIPPRKISSESPSASRVGNDRII